MLSKKVFNEKMGKITLLWNRKDFDGALSVVDEILLDGEMNMRVQALLFSGMIKRDQGLLEDARQSWLDALNLAGEGTFVLYQLQHNIGDSYQQEGLTDHAISWHSAAIRTCIVGDEFSCDQTLSSLLSVYGGRIPEDDEQQIASGIEKSWRVLELPGAPDLTDLLNAITNLNEGFQNLLAETEGEI